ncbi:hypothetical protein [Nocardioides daphniae]|uniref:hypothetical protein n=1 Tax=Nocardioides daphniae TaxID=402297 RepID=UPI00131562FB|nr:hypothetical protein [Nocardioides daphniae]
MRNGYRRRCTPRSQVERLLARATEASAPHHETQARVDVFPDVQVVIEPDA